MKPDVLYVGFLQQEPSAAALKRLAALEGDGDLFRIDGRELYWLLRRSVDDSVITGPQLGKALGMPTTTRNVNTVQRLAAKLTVAG